MNNLIMKAKNFYQQCKFDATLDICKKILKKAKKVEDIYAAKNLIGYCHFMKGDIKKGWKYYRFRPSAIPRIAVLKRIFDIPEWKGEIDKECNLFIPGEEGLGDELLYTTFLHLAVERVKQVYLECDKRLITLLSNTYPKIIYFERENQEKFVDAGTRCNKFILSSDLPKYLNPECEQGKTIPLKTAGARICARPRFTIGISYFTFQPSAYHRMPTCEWWHHLFKRFPEVLFINLQENKEVPKDKRSFLYDYADLSHIQGMDPYNNFTDLACIINNLDLTIHISNTVAHLAGRLEKPSILITQKFLRFYWLIGGNPNMFYPNMKIIRGEIPGSWDGVKEKLIEEIQAVIDRKRTL
jgi:hypothetical protein